jgi:hypothetical protein
MWPIAGKITLSKVMLAIMNGNTTPQKAMNLVKPDVLLTAPNHTIKTKAFTNNCKIPAVRFSPWKRLEKFAIKKKENPTSPDIVIFCFCDKFFIKSFLSYLITIIIHCSLFLSIDELINKIRTT